MKGGNETCPIGIDQDEWDKLVAYWQGHETQKKSENMVDSRGAVKKVSHLRHGGKAATEVRLVSLCLLLHTQVLTNVDIVTHACHIS